MVEDRITDGTRIAQLLSSELDGREGRLAALSVVDADPGVEPTDDGARAYEVVRSADGIEEDGPDGDRSEVAQVFVHPDRVRVEFAVAPDRALELAEEAGLRGRPKASDPPRALVFVESGAEVKRAADVFEAFAAGE